MSVLSRNQETHIESVLGLEVGAILVGQMNTMLASAAAAAAAGQGPATPPVGPPLVNHTVPTYVAATDYTEMIDGTLVTYLTTTAVQAF